METLDGTTNASNEASIVFERVMGSLCTSIVPGEEYDYDDVASHWESQELPTPSTSHGSAVASSVIYEGSREDTGMQGGSHEGL